VGDSLPGYIQILHTDLLKIHLVQQDMKSWRRKQCIAE